MVIKHKQSNICNRFIDFFSNLLHDIPCSCGAPFLIPFCKPADENPHILSIHSGKTLDIPLMLVVNQSLDRPEDVNLYRRIETLPIAF
jgi:hypothetical protein